MRRRILQTSKVTFTTDSPATIDRNQMPKKKSAIFNGNITTIPFRPAGTHLAGNLIAWHKDLRFKAAYQVTLTSAAYKAKGFGSEDKAAGIVLSELKWRQKYELTKAIWPLLQLLRTADSNSLAMGVIFMACVKSGGRTDETKKALDEVFDSNKDDYEEGVITVFEEVRVAYEKHAPKLKHTWSMTSFLANPNPMQEAKDFGCACHTPLIIAAEEVVHQNFHGDSNTDGKLFKFSNSLSLFNANGVVPGTPANCP